MISPNSRARVRDGGFAARVVSGFDKDRFVLANGSGFSVSEVGNTLSGNTYPSSVTGSNAFAGHERVEVDDERNRVARNRRRGAEAGRRLRRQSRRSRQLVCRGVPGGVDVVAGTGTHRLRSRHRADRAVLGAFDSRVRAPRSRRGSRLPRSRTGSRTPPARDPPTPPSRGSSFSTRSTSPRRGSRGSRTGRSAPSRRRFGSGRAPRTPRTGGPYGTGGASSLRAQLVKRLTKRV